ncbi:MAG: hypothetical protein RLZZ31_607 [Actinomycetota bacterium]|jgi:glyoxylase-like metal-dependent hydrolase (beta-lactamase superfamily II)
MNDLGPMPPTPDIGPAAKDAGRLEPISPNVWAWIGNGTPNVGVIVEDDGITLVDTTCSPSVARALLKELQQFNRPVRRVVYTSSHVESVGGSSVFWMAARYGRTQTNVLLDQPVPFDAYKRLVPQFAHEYQQTDDHTSFTTRPVSHVVDAAAWLTEKVSVVPVSGQQAENLIVMVPDADTIFAGTFAPLSTTPNAWDGNPEVWADTLTELDAKVVVGSAGPIGAKRHLVALAAYLYACSDAEGDARRIPDGPWDDWPLRDLDEINTERAASLAKGENTVPQAMLKRLGITT